MQVHNIDLGDIKPHGKVELTREGSSLQISTHNSIYKHFHKDDCPIKHYAKLERKFKLPFRVEMKGRAAIPEFYFLIGRGNVNFGGESNRAVTDILGNYFKPNSYEFNNFMTSDEDFTVAVYYTFQAMWIEINGELCCISKKSPYIKAYKDGTVPEEFADGFSVAIACDKLYDMTVQELTITEYDTDAPIPPTAEVRDIWSEMFANYKKKSTLEECAEALDPKLGEELLSIDEYLLKQKKPTLKFKRTIVGSYPKVVITYASPHGFRCRLEVTLGKIDASVGWISYNSHREQEKYGGYKKADHNVATLEELAKTSPEFAHEMFYRLKECANCSPDVCRNRDVYTFDGMTKLSCGWGNGFYFTCREGEFDMLKQVVDAIERVLAEKG